MEIEEQLKLLARGIDPETGEIFDFTEIQESAEAVRAVLLLAIKWE